MSPVMVELISFGEECDIHRVADAQGNTIDLIPIPHSERYTITLKMPDGVEVKAEISLADYENHVVPAFPGGVDVGGVVDTDELSRHLP